MNNFDFSRFHRQANWSMIFLFILLFAGCVFLSGCNPNIQLDPSQWVCSKVEDRYQSKLLPTGKFVIPTGEKVKMCVEWRMM